MRAVMCAALLLSLSAWADEEDQGPRSVPAVVNRQDLSDQISSINDLLDQAMTRARSKPGAIQALRRAREQLTALQSSLDGAPTPREWYRQHRGDGDGRDRDNRRDDRSRDGDGYQSPPPGYTNAPAPQGPPPGYGAPQQPPVVQFGQPAGPRPMPNERLGQLAGALDREGFSDSRLQVLAQGADHQFFLTAQVDTLLKHFPFPQERLAAVRTLNPHILDRENTFQLYAEFPSPSDKDQLRQILSH